MLDANFFWAKGDLLSKHKERLVHGPLKSGPWTGPWPAATATGRTAQSCTRFSDQNVCVTSWSMWEVCVCACARACVCVCVCAFSICTALMDWWGYWLTNICWISTVFLPALDLVFLFSQQKRLKVQGNLNWVFWELWSWFLLQRHKIQVTWFFKRNQLLISHDVDDSHFFEDLRNQELISQKIFKWLEFCSTLR